MEYEKYPNIVSRSLYYLCTTWYDVGYVAEGTTIGVLKTDVPGGDD